MSETPKLETHPFAEIFPIHAGQPLRELSDNIKQRGLQEPIRLYEGKVLDGRRRLLGCADSGVEPRFEPFVGTEEDALEFVMSTNLHRRHLTEAERAMSAAKHQKLLLDKAGVKPTGPHHVKGATTAEVAAQHGASERLVRTARTVVTQGTPELQQAVQEGTVSLSDASIVAKETPEIQNQAVAEVEAGFVDTATEVVARKRGRPAGSGKAGSNGTTAKPKSKEFDDAQGDHLLGEFARWCDARKNKFGVHAGHGACMRAIIVLKDCLNSWKAAVK